MGLVRVGIYARISRDDRDTQLGVNRQIKDVTELVDRLGWTVTGTYVDNDVSATSGKRRPEYERLIRDASAGLLDAVAVWDVDRLTRRPRELEDVIDLADRHGLRLASVGGDIDLGTPQGRLTARIKGSVARHEAEQMGRRLARKHRELVEQGVPHVFPPFGYRLDLTAVDEHGRPVRPAPHVIYEPEARVVRDVATKLLAGRPIRALAAELNTAGVRTTKGNPWSAQTVRRMIGRPVYAGLKTYKGKVAGVGQWPAILDRATHEQIVALLADPGRRTQRGNTRRHLLSGLLVCGHCAAQLTPGELPATRMISAVGRMNHTTGRRQSGAYTCGVCFRVRRNRQAVDDLITGVVVERLSRPDAADLFRVGDRDAAAAATRIIEVEEARMRAAAEQCADDAITPEQLAIITGKARSRIAEQRAVLAATAGRSDLAELAGPEIRGRWDGLPLDVKRAVIAELMTITVLPAGSGARFDPELIRVDWRRE
jgi:DNA invertase Pin-like site-specific DNA recombinase